MKARRTGLRGCGQRFVSRLGVEILEARFLMSGDSLPLPPELFPFNSDTELRDYIIARSLRHYESYFGNVDFLSGAGCVEDKGVDSDVVAQGYSSTNTQVAGVDEGDLNETDGSYIYRINEAGLLIVDVADPTDMKIRSRTAIKGYATALLLNGDRLTVISGGALRPGPSAKFGSGCSSYGYDGQSVVTIFDVSDRSAPVILQETMFDGSAYVSRSIGDDVYVVASSRDSMLLPPPQLFFDEALAAERPRFGLLSNARYETRDAYIARFAGREIELAMPHFTTRVGNDELSGLLAESTDTLRFTDETWRTPSMTTILTFDTSSPSLRSWKSTAFSSSEAFQVNYATSESFYVGFKIERTPRTIESASENRSLLLKFDLNTASNVIELDATGFVPGRLESQFSLDEHEGFLRAAVTTTESGRPVNQVLVLQQNRDLLEVVGSTETFGLGMDIRSVRFEGERAWVSVFRFQDPFFAIDLSDPEAPRITGELVVPGFSTYFQPIDDNHVVGFGYNADPETGRNYGMQLSLYNVASPSEPLSIETEKINSDVSEIHDHQQALGYYPEYGIIATPVAVGDPVYVHGSQQTFPSALMLWRLDLSAPEGSRIQLIETIEHADSLSRGVRIGDVLYSVSWRDIQARSLLDPTRELGALSFSAEVESVSKPRLVARELERERTPVQTEGSAPALLPEVDLTPVAPLAPLPKPTPTSAPLLPAFSQVVETAPEPAAPHVERDAAAADLVFHSWVSAPNSTSTVLVKKPSRLFNIR